MTAAPETLAAALVAFQADAPALQRDKINPAFSSGARQARYLSLEALLPEVLPLLTRAGLAVMQFPTFVGDAGALRTRLVHGPSGEYIEDTMLLNAEKKTPQSQGAAITYARRQSFMAILGLTADEDNDANAPRKSSGSTRAEPGKINAKQRKEIFDAVRAKKMPTDRAREIVKSVADVDETTDIPAEKFKDVLAAIREAA